VSDTSPEPDLGDELDRLYTVAPAGFVTARDALVRRLRAAGRGDDAAAVKGLRRPTVAAWALNQLARRRGDDVRRLIGHGQDLRRVQEEMLAGGDRDRLRAATRARRSTVDDLAEATLALLAEEGRSGVESHRDEILATLEAASLEPDAGAALLEGRLTVALAPSAGFGLVAPIADDVSPPRPAPAPETADAAGDGDAARSARLAEAREVVADARALASQRRSQAATLSERADVARRAADAAEERLARLARELEEARRSSAAAAAEAREAEARAAGAERAAAAAEAQARAAQAAVAKLEGA